VQIGADADGAKAEAAELARLAIAYGARYDGGEIVQGEVWGPSLGTTDQGTDAS
jgi:hypothetical protein